MTASVRVFFFIFLFIQSGGCYRSPRMVKEFHYRIPKQEVLDQCRDALTELGYELEVFAPESHLLITKPTRIRRTLRRYDYAIVVYVTDRIEVYLVVERHIFKRGSESSIGGQEQVEKQVVDTMPLSLRNKVFLPILHTFGKVGFYEMKTR